MQAKRSTAKNVNDYISQFPKETKKVLQEVRAIIKKTAPKAEEGISYAIPYYKYNGMLVSFAGYAKHIGFYPGAAAIKEFKKDIARYKSAVGSVQFPLSEPMPVKLITRFVKFRMKINAERLKLKKKLKY